MGLTRKRRKGGNRNEILFPSKSGVDYSKLKMTPEGEYSITKRKDGEILMRHIKSIVKNTKQKTIADLTGNVGGDTILFGMNFKKVYSFEINPENFEVLTNNVEVFGLKNVEVTQGDSTKLYDGNTDVLYIDAPWGGPDYKEKKDMDLFLGSERIDLYVQKVMDKEKHPDYIFLKLPSNYNFERFNSFETKVFRIRGYYVMALFAA